MISFVLGIFEESLLFFPLVLGLYVSFCVLRISDLTADAAFVLGAGLLAKALAQGASPAMAMLLAVGISTLVGVANSLLQAKGRLHPLLAGIFLLFALGSLTLILMGRPNIDLSNMFTIFSFASQIFERMPQNLVRLGVLVVCNMFVVAVVFALLSSRIGLVLKAYGDQPNLLVQFGRNPTIYRTLGLVLGSSLSAFSGVMTAQNNGYADVGMGVGKALIGIAVLMVGLHLRPPASKKTNPHVGDGGCLFLATLFYFGSIGILVKVGLNPLYLRAVIGMAVCLFFVATPRASSFLMGDRK